jgi:hypothetical protein
MTDIDELKKQFSEIGLGEYPEKQLVTESLQFDFDYSKYLNSAIQETIITNNTKNQELCPIGTK